MGEDGELLLDGGQGFFAFWGGGGGDRKVEEAVRMSYSELGV